MIRRCAEHRRPGKALVEFTLVAIIFFMFLFGILEYGRLVWVMNMMDNAAREGARYAVVNTNQGSALTSQVQDQVDQRLSSTRFSLVGYDKTTSITVMAVDPSTGNQLTDANGNAIPPEGTAFGQAILVQITATYQPVTPGLLKLPGTLTVRGTSMMKSEAN